MKVCAQGDTSGSFWAVSGSGVYNSDGEVILCSDGFLKHIEGQMINYIVCLQYASLKKSLMDGAVDGEHSRPACTCGIMWPSALQREALHRQAREWQGQSSNSSCR